MYVCMYVCKGRVQIHCVGTDLQDDGKTHMHTMYACIYAGMYIYIYIYIYIYTFTYAHVRVYIATMYACMYVCMYIYIYICTCVVCVCIYICIYTAHRVSRIHAHAFIDTYTRARARAQVLVKLFAFELAAKFSKRRENPVQPRLSNALNAIFKRLSTGFSVFPSVAIFAGQRKRSQLYIQILYMHAYYVNTYADIYIHTYIHTYIQAGSLSMQTQCAKTPNMPACLGYIHNTHTYSHTYTHTHIYTYIHTYIHTYRLGPCRCRLSAPEDRTWQPVWVHASDVCMHTRKRREGKFIICVCIYTYINTVCNIHRKRMIISAHVNRCV
jgi:hypothetical protein